jgi:outer membrane receptor for ferrienterochelin and colicin
MKRLIPVFLALAIAAPLQAQQPANQTLLRLVVIDETGAGIPTATIVVTPQTGEPITFATDEKGVAASPPLPTGAAKLRVEFTGFEPYEGAVNLRRGAMNQTVTLKIAGLTEEVVVSNESAEDLLRSSTATTTLSQEEIDALPDDEEELRLVLEEMAGPGGATFLMNGFRGGRLPTRDEIRAIRFRQNSFAADGHDAGRTSIEIVTRPSTQFAGNVNFGFKGDAWNARNALARVETPEGEKNAQFSIRGPLVPGKTSLRFNGQANSSYESETIIALDEQGNSLGTQWRNSRDRTGFTTALEHSITDNQSLFLEFQHSQNESPGQGVGGFNLPERATRSDGRSNQLRARVQGLVGRTTLHEIRLDLNRQSSESTSYTSGPTIVVQDAFTKGGGGVNNRRLTQTFELADNVDFTIGRRHQMRVGMLLEGGIYETFDEQNKDGRFTFASLADYHAGRPLQFTQRLGTLDTSITQYQLGFYWQDDIRVNNRLSLGVGVRNELQSRIDDRLNLMPRIGFTLNPGGTNTAIRGGYGIFHDWYEASLYDQTVRLNGEHQTDLLILNPGYPDPFTGTAVEPRPGGRVIASPDLKMPYQHQVSLGIEHRLRQNWQMSVSYQALRGRNQMRSRNINAPIDGVVPDPTRGIVTRIESTGRSQSDRISVQSRIGVPQRRINFNVSYTYGMGKSHLTGTQLPSDSFNPDVDWGPSGQDIRHQVQMQGMLPLPYGFRVNAQFRAQSGPAYNLTTGIDDNRDGVVNDRPAGVARNSLRGDGFWTVSSMRVSKNFSFGPPRTAGGGPGGRFGGGPQGSPQAAAQSQQPGALFAQRGGGGAGGRGGFGGRGGGPNEANSRYSVEIFLNASNPLNRVIPQGYSGNILSPFFGRTTSVQSARRVDFGMAFRW